MAILIPSKRIYDIQNPKVIENALKRIDVEQNKTTVIHTSQDTEHLEDILQGGTVGDIETSEVYNRIIPTTGTDYMFGAGLRIDSKPYSVSVELPRLYDDYYITEIAPTIEVDFNVTISTVSAISYLGTIPSGSKRINFEVANSSVYNTRQTNSKNYNFSTSKNSFDIANSFLIDDTLSVLSDKIYADFSVTNLSESENSDNRLTSKMSLLKIATNIHPSYPYSIGILEQTVEKYKINAEFITQFTVWFAQDHALSSLKDTSFSRPIEATKIEFVATKAKIVYNETIRTLNLESLTTNLVNENSNGEARFSITNNPFVRTENKYSGQNATNALYRNTLNKYANGKETAKVRCSIGEYADENGNLVISTKTPDKMLFEHYDKVVPMVRNGEGIDLAMSYTADGLAKVFDVVGVRVFFDGAVWQELTLRESGESIDIGRTTYTTIANDAGGLTYKITSNEIVTEENSARGITYIIGE